MQSETTEKSGEKAASNEGQLHKPPSMLWFVIPFGLLLLYGALSH